MQPTATAAAAAAQERRRNNLALAFQELLVVSERLRSNRQQVPNAEAFRQQVREALKLAEQEALRQGYSPEEIQHAVFPCVAYLDESILNLRLPVFADWPRRPLQEELFGHHVAGEIFFQNVQKLLTLPDSHQAADLLEVYHLCLLLGFAGRYSMGARGELRSIAEQVGAKIRRIRGVEAFSPAAGVPQDMVSRRGGDPLIKPLLFGAIALLLLTIGLFVFYSFSLGAGVSRLASIASGRGI
ncbi:MAG: type IVB secretion system protein IcmH/DotU [Bryobacteraceae bacterium]|nr:type IVB secretion system protein IcmH/DotU [Bryobacteraceae bacterium]